MNTNVIRFTDVGVAKYEEIKVPNPTADDVVINMSFTTISNGTERDAVLGVNSSKKTDNPFVTPADHFPLLTGYSGAGIVEWVGKNVTSVKVGDRVATASGYHAKHLVRPERLVNKIPDSVSLQSAAIAHIANFPLGGVRKTEIEIGESALVVGAGILGIFAVQYLKICGACPIIVSDFSEERRKTALALGADYALDPSDIQYIQKIKKYTDSRMINVAIEVTGSGAALDQTLDCMAFLGRVSLLGCTRTPDHIIDFYRKVHYPGIKLVGAHAGARPQIESGKYYWTEKEDIITVMRLAALGRIKMEELICETHSPQEAPQTYKRLAYDKAFPLCVQFDWRNEM